MAKNHNTPNIQQEHIQAIIGNTAAQVLNEVELQVLELSDKHKQETAKAFEEAVGNLEQVASNTVQGVGNNIKDSLESKLNKIDGLPDDAKKALLNGANKMVDQVTAIAEDTIKEAATESKKIFNDCMKQLMGAVKSIFSNIGAVIKGEKSQDQAIADIKSAWQEAGKEVLQSAQKSGEKVKTSFAERVGGKKSQDQGKSHGDKILEERNNPEKGPGPVRNDR